jgi:hypothetical protein
VRAKDLPSNPADGIELPRKHEVEQRYLTHEQLIRPRALRRVTRRRMWAVLRR